MYAYYNNPYERYKARSNFSLKLNKPTVNVVLAASLFIMAQRMYHDLLKNL